MVWTPFPCPAPSPPPWSCTREAYGNAKKLVWYGLRGAILLSALLIAAKSFYVDIYAVEAVTKNIASDILLAFALVAPIKVLNMILGGGIVRSGGKTKLIMWIDLMGTWIFGVPLGYLSAFVLNNLAVLGYDYLLPLTVGCNFGIAAACLAVFLKTKNKELKEIAGPDVISALIGGVDIVHVA